MQNCKALQKEKFLMQDKKKSHGKADACRGFLTKYYRKRSFLKRISPYDQPPFGEAFFWAKLCVVKILRNTPCDEISGGAIGI